MPTTQLPIPINGYSDSMNLQHGAEGFSTSMMNVVPMDVWQNRRRVGTRQGFTAIADMGNTDDFNIQEMLEYEVYRSIELVSEVMIVAGGSVFYADKNGDTHDVAYSTAGATATVTFTGLPTATKKIVITANDGSASTITATADGSTTTSSDIDNPTFQTVTDAATTAGNLATCLNANAHLTASASGAVVTITQVDAGSATSTGNTEITGDLDNATYTNFSGAAYAAGQNRIQNYDTVRAVQFGNNVYLVTGRQYYKIDFSKSVPIIEEWTNYNGTGDMPSDNGGNKCSLITKFGGRIVMSGLSSSRNNWFMSKIGDPEDWSPTASSNSDAQAGDSSTEFGILGDPITAIFPFGDQGLMMATRHNLTYLTADPVVSGAQMVKMSNGVGVVGPDAWCQGPEKTCYVVSKDGVYLIQPNQFNIQRGQSTTTARLDGFFASLTPNEVEIHLAYDPPRSMIMMFVNRTLDPDNVVHYMHHIPTQSWWTLQVSDPRMDVVTSTCLFSPLAGDREGLWIGFDSGRISCQPTTGVVPYDGGIHTSPLKSLQNNAPDPTNERVFTSRLAWSPINSGLSNERLLMSEIGVLLDTNELPDAANAPDGSATMVKSGPTLNLYGGDTAQLLAGISGDVGVTETRQTIDGGAAGASISTYLDGGDAVGKATCTVTVVAYNLLDAGVDGFTLKDTTGTSKTFLSHAATTGSTTFAIGANNNATAANIVTMLADGSNSAWTGVAADNVVTITQNTAGSKGNQPVTNTAEDTELTTTNFTGGQISIAGIGYPLYPEVIIELSEATISDLDGKDVIFNDLNDDLGAVTITFESSLATNASTTAQAGCSDADEDLLSIMKGLRKSIDLNYKAGLLNLKTEEPYLHASGSPAYMKIRTTDAWNGYSPMPTVTDGGSGAVNANYIQAGGADPVFTHDQLAEWAEFVDGGKASRVGGTLALPTSSSTYSLDDSAASETLRKWSLGNMYTVRKMGNRSTGSDPSQYEGVWAIFDKSSNKPLYIASEATATISLANMTTTEVLPSGFTSSTAITDPTQDESGKSLLQSWTLNEGRNNRYRVRNRESDFQVEISASGTAWVLEDISVTVDAGGKYRGLVS
tara:strand:+ start:8498 stop:11785 length:3288 start_codon:yes stop_codon:yes gene_type:complete